MVLHPFVQELRMRAAQYPQPIAFPEATDERILQACDTLAKAGICQPVLVGRTQDIQNAAHEAGVSLHGMKIVDHLTDEAFEKYEADILKTRKHKGMTPKKAKEWLHHPMYYATLLLKHDRVKGLVAGATQTTADTLRPPLQLLKKDNHLVLTFFFMVLPDKVWVFADCALNIDPPAKALATIAEDTYHSAENFGIDARMALLSFSTKGSAKHPLQEKVAQATKILEAKDMLVDGELQFDAALVPEIAARKNPHGTFQGDANVYIFPNLDAGNIAYKLLQRMGGAQPIGPIVQGLPYPVNDLSRGAEVDEIINTVTITVLQAQARS